MRIPFTNRAFPVDLLHLPRREWLVCRVLELPPGSVTSAGPWAVGNSGGRLFAVSKSCRHLAGDLSLGSIDGNGCLVCPVHGARYDVGSGKMVRGPLGIYGKIPGLQAAFESLTRVLPLRRGEIEVRDDQIYVR